MFRIGHTNIKNKINKINNRITIAKPSVRAYTQTRDLINRAPKIHPATKLPKGMNKIKYGIP